MNYIYDILLNFFKTPYEFYEWKSSDNIINVRKIPVFKVKDNIYLSMLNNSVTLSAEFIDIIKNKTSIYAGKKQNNYMCLFTNGQRAFGAQFNSDGRLEKKSYLLLEEEGEIINESILYDETEVNITSIIEEDKKEVGRVISEKRKTIIKFLNKNKQNINILKYIYFDYFEKEENNINIIYNALKEEIILPSLTKINKLYNTIILLNKIKN